MLRRGGVAALWVALVVTSCAGVKQQVGGWFGAKTPPSSPGPAAAQPPRVYYAAVDGLKVYSEPSASSQVVGTLSLHEKVTRSGVERGYAYVTSSKSGLTGWVGNAQLIWRLPAAAAPAGEAAPEAPVAPEPEAPEPVAPAPEPPPTTTTTRVRATSTSSTIPAGRVPPSIFNPY